VAHFKLNKDLCNLAQEWAEKIALTGKFEHSNNRYLNQSLGLNLFFEIINKQTLSLFV
jgi:hypothetical protein